MRIHVDYSTMSYEISHNQKPRGYGYWLFACPLSAEPFGITANYGEAKTKAFAHFREMAAAQGRQFVLLKVLP